MVRANISLLARRSLAAAVVLATVLQTAGMALKLDLGPINLENGGRVEFHQTACDPIASLPFRAKSRRVVRTMIGRYEVLYRIDDITAKKDVESIEYLLYIREQPTNGRITECVISGRPYGSFRAQFADISFSVEEPSTPTEVSSLRLPVVSFYAPSNLEAFDWNKEKKKAEGIVIGEVTEITVPLTNLSNAWPIRVTSVTTFASGGPKWRRAEALTAGNKQFVPFSLNPGTSSNLLVVRLDPNPGNAFWRSLSSGSGPHSVDYFPISVQYETTFGSTPIDGSPVKASIPVQLIPWPPVLPLSLTAGALLGSLIPFLAKRKGSATHLKAFLASWIVAVLAWLLAIFLKQSDSEFRMGGFALDPFQIIPCTLIGSVAGVLGLKNLAVAQWFIYKLWGEPPPPPPPPPPTQDPGTREPLEAIPSALQLPFDHPLPQVRETTDAVLKDLTSRRSEILRRRAPGPTIPADQLLRALLLQILYSIRGERLLMEQVDHNLLFRSFVGLGAHDPIWAPAVFAERRARLFESGVAGEFFSKMSEVGQLGPPSNECFNVDYAQLEAWANRRAQPRAVAPAANSDGDQLPGEQPSNDMPAPINDPEGSRQQES